MRNRFMGARLQMVANWLLEKLHATETDHTANTLTAQQQLIHSLADGL